MSSILSLNFFRSNIRSFSYLCKVNILNNRISILKLCKHMYTYNQCFITDSGEKSNISRRFSLDTKTNASGLRLIQLCKDSDLCILNGRTGQDDIGQFSFQGAQGTSLIDYVLLTPDFMSSISDFCCL